MTKILKALNEQAKKHEIFKFNQPLIENLSTSDQAIINNLLYGETVSAEEFNAIVEMYIS